MNVLIIGRVENIYLVVIYFSFKNYYNKVDWKRMTDNVLFIDKEEIDNVKKILLDNERSDTLIEIFYT